MPKNAIQIHDEKKSLAAMGSIVDALTPLEHEAQTRVLNSVIALFGFTLEDSKFQFKRREGF